MKRKSFMDSVSHEALMRKEITEKHISKHKALSGLSDEFRKSAKWLGPEVPPPDSEGMVLQMLRMPLDEPNPTDNVSLAFVDRSNHKGDPKEISPEPVKGLLDDLLNHISPMPHDCFRVGPVVLDDLQFPATADWVAGVLGLKKPDAAIARAFHSAQLGAFISNVGPIDPGAITVALGTFIHSHPAFRKLIDEGKWHKPFGDRTAYQLLRRA
jgi:hypothetical protein